MLKFSAIQMGDGARRAFFRRVQTFIGERSHHEDFRLWARDEARLHALWAPLWPDHSRHSEHDVALAMVVVAACAHAQVTLAGDALAVLGGIGESEVRVKQWLADQGYVDFTAFDMPAEVARVGATA